MFAGYAGMILQPLYPYVDFVGRVAQQRGDTAHIRSRLHTQDFHFIHGGISIVYDVINGPREGEDILTVNRSDKGTQQFVDQNASDLIGLFLSHHDFLGDRWILFVHISLKKLHTLESEGGLVQQ